MVSKYSDNILQRQESANSHHQAQLSQLAATGVIVWMRDLGLSNNDFRGLVADGNIDVSVNGKIIRAVMSIDVQVLRTPTAEADLSYYKYSQDIHLGDVVDIVQARALDGSYQWFVLNAYTNVDSDALLEKAFDDFERGVSDAL